MSDYDHFFFKTRFLTNFIQFWPFEKTCFEKMDLRCLLFLGHAKMYRKHLFALWCQYHTLTQCPVVLNFLSLCTPLWKQFFSRNPLPPLLFQLGLLELRLHSLIFFKARFIQFLFGYLLKVHEKLFKKNKYF